MQAIKQLHAQGEFKKGDQVVVIFPDHGSRYMSKVYSDKWMEQQGFFDSKNISAEHIQYIK
jgi:cystathionine beta-synthase